MIDFTNCPKDKVWLLFDSEGNSQRITTDIELQYARLEIVSKELEGYYLAREDDASEKYEIDKYGFIEDFPLDLFCVASSLLAKAARIGDRNFKRDRKIDFKFI